MPTFARILGGGLVAASLALAGCSNEADTSPNANAPTVPPSGNEPATPSVNTPTNAPPPTATVAPPPADMPPSTGASTGSPRG